MPTKVVKLAKVRVQGVVQGVGFRPYIYRLAQEHNLKGWVRNTSGNVEIEVEGDEATLENFLSNLEAKAPPMAPEIAPIHILLFFSFILHKNN